MTIFLNYYQRTTSAVRGGSVYTAMLAKRLRSFSMPAKTLYVGRETSFSGRILTSPAEVSVLNVPWQKRKFIPGPLSKYLTFPYRRIAKLSRSELVHLPGPFNPGCFACKGKILTTFHDQVNYDFYTRPSKGQLFLRQLEALTAAKTDYVIASSQFSADRTLARFPKFEGKMHVVYPGIDDVFFEKRSRIECDRMLENLNIQPQSPFLLYVGATSPHKNHKSVIATYARLRQTHPQMKLVMVGAIRKRREFATLTQDLQQRRLSLNTDVIIPTRRLSNLALSALYQSASVFLFPSLYEGWGMVVGEALASGTPAIISDIPVFRECFAGGALMVNPHNIEEMAAGVVSLLNQPGLREVYRRRGRALVRDRTWKNVAAETVGVYRQYAPKPRVYA